MQVNTKLVRYKVRRRYLLWENSSIHISRIVVNVKYQVILTRK